MYILCIYASPRKNGNTDILLDKFIDGVQSSSCPVLPLEALASRPSPVYEEGPEVREIEKIFIRDLNISYCKECRECEITGICVIKDDMQKIYPKLQLADYTVVSAPIFFCNVPAKLKTFIDRSQCQWAKKYLLGGKNEKKIKIKRGIFLSVCGSRHSEFFDCAKLTLKYFFDAYDIQYWNELFASKIDNLGEILKYPEILDKSYKLGKKIYEPFLEKKHQNE